jgi:HipA-like protein
MKARLDEVLRALGLRGRSVDPSVGTDEELRVYLAVESDHIYVGRLRREKDEFEFSYSSEFQAREDLPSITDFPDKTRNYRSPVLWPFFMARLPPSDRPDVRRQLEAAGIEPGNTLEVLGKLGRRAISSPYDLELFPAT